MSTDPRFPDYVRPEVREAADDLALIHDLLGGTRGIQGAKALKEYLPPWPDETLDTYAKRAKAATLFEGLQRVLSASVGLIFATPPQLTFPRDEARLRAHWDNIDGAGTKGDVFAKRFTESAIADGFALILVDHPSRPVGVTVTAANEARLGLRPRWASYPRASVLSWRVETIANEQVVTQLVLHEPTAVALGDYGIGTMHRYRVLRVVDGIAGYVVWEKPEQPDGQWRVVEEGLFRNRRGETRDTLPIAVAYTGRTDAPFTAAPPLRAVAYANLAHWRNKTELQWGSGLAAIEQPVITGDLVKDEGESTSATIKTGWEHYIHLQQGGTFEYKGPSGSGLDQLEKRMREAEQEMAALGMSFLSRDTRAAETAEAKRLDATAENSTLATAAQGIEDALNLAWSHHAWFEGFAESEAPTLVLNRDFERVALDATYIGAIGALVREGFPVRMAVQMLAQGGVIPTTDAAELDLLALEWEAGGQARADAEALALEQAQRGRQMQAAA